MKTLGKKFRQIIMTLIIVVILIGGVAFYFKDKFNNLFNGTNTTEYSFVIKRFSEQVKLVVADADTDTNRKQTFSNKTLNEWPKWTEKITRFFVGRDLEVVVPVTTEFKIDLNNVTSEDILINENVLTFKHPLTVEVDSQRTGKVKITKQASGVIDKGVDIFTSSAKAQEFFDEKTEETVYKTSKYVLNHKEEKIISASEKALSQILNLNTDKKIKVKLDKNSLRYKIIDKK